MLGAGDVINVFELFQLNLLDSEWVNEIWRERFTSCPEDLPDSYSELFSLLDCSNTLEIIKQSHEITNKWLATEPSTRAEGSSALTSWSSLQEVPHKPLLALLYFYIKKCNNEEKNLSMVELGLRAAELYFTLLAIPGSSIYKIFDVSLFEAAVEVFSFHRVLEKIDNAPVGKGQKRNKSFDGNNDCHEDMSVSEQRAALKILNEVLLSFQKFCSKFSFKNHLDALKISLNALGELTRCERQVSVKESSSSKTSFASLARNAYLTMASFCTDNHGRVSEIVRLVLFRIMPNLSLVGGSSYPEINKWSGKEQTVVRNSALWFVQTHIVPLGQPAFQSLKILIHHLCRQMTDRADYRAKATDMVISIICFMPEDFYFAILKWLFRESLVESANHRVVALELLSKLIYLKQGNKERSNIADPSCSNIPEVSRSHLDPSHMASRSNAASFSVNQSENNGTGVSESTVNNERVVSFSKPIQYVPIEYRRMMLAIIIDRLRDSATSVRCKALNALSEIISNRTSPTVMGLIKAIFVTPYEAFDEIDINTPEQSFVEWSVIVAAMNKINDLNTNNSLIPGGISIVKVIQQRCLEERVNVRRAALSLFANLFKLNSKWMTQANLESFGQHCRDPAMQVRKEMVGSVTDLMLYFPSHQQLTQLWVEEVVPQIADREIRVQENALSVLTKIILANIKPLEKTQSSTDALPWQLLTNIASLKMRSFLATTCRLWRDSKTPEMNSSRINAIISHIGSAQDAPAWVMLAALSEFIPIPNPQPIMDYYLDVIAKGDGNSGTTNLVLITLINSWQDLKKDNQIKLQKHLHESLKNRTVQPPIIPMVVNLYTAMVVVLYDEELQGKKEVAKWAVETVHECEKHLEPCLDPKSEDRGNCESCISYLMLLGSLAELHPQQISRNTFEIIYNFLMSTKSAQQSTLCKMKAVAVIALGRMALCDNFIASRLVAGLSTLISNYTDPVLLINVVVAVADIGERFPNLIEPLVSALSLCLKNRHQNVREMTLVITIDLLQEDYLKPRGALIYHLLSLIDDQCPRTSSIVKFYCTSCMLPKSIQSLNQTILKGMFHFNKYDNHIHFPKLDMTDAEETAFNLSGPRMRKKRMAVYRFLMKSLDNEQRTSAFVEISRTILGGIVDNLIDFNSPAGEELVLDSFAVLTAKEILTEFRGSKKKGDGDDDDDEREVANTRDDVRKDILEKILWEETKETLIPTCSRIRKIISKNKRLHGPFYKFVYDRVIDYKNDLEQLFHEDKMFGVEISHMVKNDLNPNPEEEEVQQEVAPAMEPNAEAVVAEVREEIMVSSGRERHSKRKSDEMQSQKEAKKKKTGEGNSEELDANTGEDDIQCNELQMALFNLNSNDDVSKNDRRKASTDSKASLKNARKSRDKVENEKPRALRTRTTRSSSIAEKSSLYVEPTRAKSVGAEEQEDSLGHLTMPPPNISNRPSRKNLATPTVPTRKAPLFSSTPLISNTKGFDASDISPVVQNSVNE